MPSSVRSREHPADQSVDWPGKTTPEEKRSAVRRLRFTVAALPRVAQSVFYRSDGAEKSMLLAVGAGAEVHCRRRPRGAAAAKRKRPQSVDGDQMIRRVLQHALELAGRRIEDVDHTRPEIPYQQIVAVDAEVSRRHRHTPRRIEPPSVLQTALEHSQRRIHIHVPKSGPFYGIVLLVVLLRERDVQITADVLHIERREPMRNPRI